MRTSVKLCFAAVAAAIMLASVVTTASARNLSVTNQNFRVTWSSLEFIGSGRTIRCRVTLEGSFHTRTITKVRDSLIGAVTKAKVHHPCTNGEAWAENGLERAPLGVMANTLPWHAQYEHFEGTLPNITAIGIGLSRYRFTLESEFFFIRCRARYGAATDRIVGRAQREAGGGITTLTPITGRNTSTKIEDLLSADCPTTGTFGSPVGDGRVTLLGTTTRITVTLI